MPNMRASCEIRASYRPFLVGSEFQSPRATGGRAFVARSNAILRMAFCIHRRKISSPDRSGVGAGARGVWKGRYSLGRQPPESLPNYFNRWRNWPELVDAPQPMRLGFSISVANVHEWWSSIGMMRLLHTFAGA